jgi:peptidoglycan/LPS O-acetylase OafA/YrhL
MNQQRLQNLDVLRAIAALAVCLYHFTLNGVSALAPAAAVFRYGYLGVDVFFVISGFVIPLMLFRMKFRYADSGSFLLARLLRLYPAYALAGVFAMAVAYLSSLLPGSRGLPPSFAAPTLISNALLICDFTGEKWIIPVFWTLAIEAQYYVLMAGSFLLLTKESKWLRYGVLAAWIAAPLIAGPSPTVFTWTALFAAGILCFLKGNNLIGRTGFWVFFVAAIAAHFMTKGALSAAAGAATALAILYLPELKSRILIWTGMISYSLYLLHPPIGGRVMNQAERLPNTLPVQSLALVVALFASIVASAIFFKLIEKPSHEFSRKVRTKKRDMKPIAAEQCPGLVIPQASEVEPDIRTGG